MMAHRQRDIVLVSFPFTDLSSSKRRPALFLSPASFNAAGRDLAPEGAPGGPRQCPGGEPSAWRGRWPRRGGSGFRRRGARPQACGPPRRADGDRPAGRVQPWPMAALCWRTQPATRKRSTSHQARPRACEPPRTLAGIGTPTPQNPTSPPRLEPGAYCLGGDPTEEMLLWRDHCRGVLLHGPLGRQCDY